VSGQRTSYESTLGVIPLEKGKRDAVKLYLDGVEKRDYRVSFITVMNKLKKRTTER
jgi:hypothetical protein